MLKGSTLEDIMDYQMKVSKLGASFSDQQDLQGATFAYTLYKMTQHVVVKEMDNLQVSSSFRILYVKLGQALP